MLRYTSIPLALMWFSLCAVCKISVTFSKVKKKKSLFENMIISAQEMTRLLTYGVYFLLNIFTCF